MKKYAAIGVFLFVLVLIAALTFPFVKSGSNGAGSASDTAAVASLTEVDAGVLVEDVHYRKAKEPSTASGKQQVQEFFWYGCPHCQSFEPAVREYKNQLPEDVELVQIPVIWNQATGLHAAMHYLAMESDNPELLQDALFETIISMRREGNLDKHIDAVEPVFAAHGIDSTDLGLKLQSPGIQKQVSDAAELMRKAGITGTPTLMVDSTWVVLNNEEVATAGPFQVVDYLLGMVQTTDN